MLYKLHFKFLSFIPIYFLKLDRNPGTLYKDTKSEKGFGRDVQETDRHRQRKATTQSTQPHATKHKLAQIQIYTQASIQTQFITHIIKGQLSTEGTAKNFYL